jgi:type IV pilus assembly protein PilO
MNMEDFNNLDPQNFGNWPIPVKTLIIIVLCIAALFAGYWFDTQNQIAQLTKEQKEEKNLRKNFKKVQREAATLPLLEKQLVEIEAILKRLLEKLPDKNQVDELIREISQAVLKNALKQELFEPQYKDEKTEKDVYVTLPIKLQARGSYHAFGQFISDVAAMNRIVTQHDISIKSSKSSGKKSTQGLLTLKMKARIYRYLDKQENEVDNTKNNKGKK